MLSELRLSLSEVRRLLHKYAPQDEVAPPVCTKRKRRRNCDPALVKPVGRPPKYPWRDLQIGDSFFVPGDPTKVRNRLSRSLWQGIKRDFKFTTRSLVENGVNGIRVWRIQ